jgi:hypothetical protein
MDAEEAMKKHMAVWTQKVAKLRKLCSKQSSLPINTEKNTLSYTLPTVATEAYALEAGRKPM